MKNFLILILSAALAAAAHFTRPSENSFKHYVKAELSKDDRTLAGKVLNAPPSGEQLMKRYSFEDRFLWVQVGRDGKILYTGAFDRWYDHARSSISEPQDGAR